MWLAEWAYYIYYTNNEWASAIFLKRQQPLPVCHVSRWGSWDTPPPPTRWGGVWTVCDRDGVTWGSAGPLSPRGSWVPGVGCIRQKASSEAAPAGWRPGPARACSSSEWHCWRWSVPPPAVSRDTGSRTESGIVIFSPVPDIDAQASIHQPLCSNNNGFPIWPRTRFTCYFSISVRLFCIYIGFFNNPR